MKTCVLIPAAGSGSRFGGTLPKQYCRIGNKTVLEHTVDRFLDTKRIGAVIVAVHPEDPYIDAVYPEASRPARLYIFRCGGATRAQTVAAALTAATGAGLADSGDRMMVHDAARCCLPAPLLQRLLDAADAAPAGVVPALPVGDTLKWGRTETDGRVWDEGTADRSRLRQAQTPQLFPVRLLSEALEKADLNNITDEASAVEALGLRPLLIEGDARNMKITRPEDAELAAFILQQEEMKPMNIRVGQGYDIHRLAAGRPLVLGGVTIPFDRGLEGHSDADALLHALTDALLGAAGLGDIGTFYPDTDAAHKDADSRELLRGAYAAVCAAGWRVVNADATVIAEKPKLRPHIDAMRANIAADLHIEHSAVNVKGKTNEGQDSMGRLESIAAQAVVLLAAV